ncbi:MAG: class sortase [Microbacteriaceae bacterium]|nr:class sortase [Microbacteriaceae bacterium]HEV7957614.1 class E sortase [Marisediminicola sp.]
MTIRDRSAVRVRHSRPDVLGVIGELLVTAGVFVFLFLGWQLWLNDLIVGGEQREEAIALSRELGSSAIPATPVAPGTDFGDPVISPVAADTALFANIYVPRFGADYVRTIAEGVHASRVLTTGAGHYPETQMPGEVGNFAIAAHRTTWGAPFNKIGELQVGDKIYVQTAEGWYTYLFRSLEYVPPTGVGVLEPVPQQVGVASTDRLITLTSCNPLLSAAERIIAYGLFDSWRPRSAGPPAEIAALAQGEV